MLNTTAANRGNDGYGARPVGIKEMNMRRGLPIKLIKEKGGRFTSF